MGSLHDEPLSGGLVTSREASLLEKGELQRTDHAVYRPNSQAIHPWGYRNNVGKQQLNPGTGLPYEITGLKRLLFEDRRATTVIADGPGLRWRYGPDGAGNWTIIPGVNARTVAAPIEAVSVGNKYILANGTDQAYVIDSDMEVIKLGMMRLAGRRNGSIATSETNCAFAITQSTATGGTWAGALTGFDLYFYWITEYDSVNDIESAYYGESHAIVGANDDYLQFEQHDGTTTGIIKIEILYGSHDYPALVNPNATHWRIYRAYVQFDGLTITANPFPLGLKIPTWGTTDSTAAISVVDIPVPTTPATVTRYDFGFDGVEPYPVIVITSQGVTSSISRDTPPTSTFSSGAIFQDCFVRNNTFTPFPRTNEIDYSPPGLYHSQPALYRIAVSPGKWDEVVLVRALGDKLVVGLTHSMWRVNWLPTGDDAIFDATNVKDMISGDHGVLGPGAACIYTSPGDIPRLAFASIDGLYSTDGFTVTPLTLDINWQGTINQGAAAMDGAVLVNYEAIKSLCLFYVPLPVFIDGAPLQTTKRLQMFVFSYAPEHMKTGGMLKVSGPITLSASSADYDQRAGHLYTGGYDGRVRTEDNEDVVGEETSELVTTNGMTIQTRFLYLGGLNGECAVERFWVLSEPSRIPERLSETLGFTVRGTNVQPSESGWSTAFNSGALTQIEKHVTSPGVAVNLQGFAPLHLVALEHSSRKGK